MNILTLVSAFIIIFAIGSYAFLQSFRNQVQETGHYISAMENSRAFFNSAQKQKYRSLPGDNLHPQKKSRTEKKSKSEFNTPRERFNPYNESKLNIFGLSTKQKDQKLEKIAADLIKYLYELAPFYTEGMEFDLVDSLRDALQDSPAITSIDTLLEKLPEENSKRFYKCFKGTQNYKLRVAGEGYPPLSDFFYFDQSAKRPIHFSYASTPLLKVVFNDAIANRILQDEREHWEKEHKHKPMNKGELGNILLEERKNPADYDNLLYFSTSRKAKPCKLLKDESTGVQIKVLK